MRTTGTLLRRFSVLADKERLRVKGRCVDCNAILPWHHQIESDGAIVPCGSLEGAWARELGVEMFGRFKALEDRIAFLEAKIARIDPRV